jgi:uncharacterized protein (DUF1015 family)
MAEIFPFAGYRYDARRVALENVLTQPYDKITPAMQERYYAASPYNLIAVEKGRTLAGDSPADNVYTRAAAKLEEWIAEGILVKDAATAIYVYSQEFTVPGTTTRRVRRGFVALGRVEDYEKRVVFRHERTLAAPKADRIELLRHTRAQTGQLFMLYDDTTGRVDEMLIGASRPPAPAEMRDEYDVLHRVWPVTDAALIQRIVAAMADKPLIIADGHHRYETALAYRDECRAGAGTTDLGAPYEKAMMTFVSARSQGLLILPTHRVVRNVENSPIDRLCTGLTKFFDWYAYPFTTDEERVASYADFRKDLEGRRERHSIGIYAGGSAFYLFLLRKDADLDSLLPDLSPAQRQLDVVLLHRLMLEKGLGITAEAVTAEKNITYERVMDAAVASVDRGEAQFACLLNPVGVGQVLEIALAGDVLPQKSTDFYPKLLSGLVVYRLE